MSETAVANEAATETALGSEEESFDLESLGQALLPQETAEEEDEGEAQAEPMAAAPEEPEDSEPDSILARLGLSDLSEEERIELNRELGGRAAERFGELTAEKKRLAAELDRLKGELGKREPFRPESKAENPYRDKTSISELEEVYRSAEQTISTAEELLEDHRDALSSDEIWELDGQPITKGQVRKMLKNAKAAIEDHIPARARELQKVESYEREREANLQAIRQLHPWMAEEGNQLKAMYDQATPDLIRAVREKMPEYLPKMDLILADHAKASWERMQSKTKPTGTKESASVKRKAPGNPGGSGGASSRAGLSAVKRRELAEKQFMESSGSKDDLAKLFLATS